MHFTYVSPRCHLYFPRRFLHVRSKRLREVVRFVQGPTASKWQSQDVRPSRAVSKARRLVLPLKWNNLLKLGFGITEILEPSQIITRRAK